MTIATRACIIVTLAGLVWACGPAPEPAAEAETPAVPAAGTASPAPAPAADAYDIDALVASADSQRGQTLFLQCRACHSLGEGEPHKVGPNLYGMFGREAGQAPGYAYSDAVVQSDIVWSPATLDQWMARPSEFLPGNRMVFIGVKKPEDRAALIAFLQQQTGATGN